MPAHVEEGAQLAVLTAHHQDRHPNMVVGAEGAGRHPFRREAHQDRIAAKQDPLLQRELRRIGVDRHVVVPRSIGQRGGPGLDVMEQLLEQPDLVLPIHRSLRQGHPRKLCHCAAARRLITYAIFLIICANCAHGPSIG
jgi:hypothetical protein